MGGLTRWITALVWLLLAAAAIGCVGFGASLHATRRINAMIADHSIEKIAPMPTDARARYAMAWNLERSQRLDEAIKVFIDLQSDADPALAADAWFALGNVYFENGIKRSRETVQQDGPQPESGEMALARDAYRSALRIDPGMHGARYNLELLERLAPARPGDGWRRNTDPITIEADRHNGWTTIHESKKRGLP